MRRRKLIRPQIELMEPRLVLSTLPSPSPQIIRIRSGVPVFLKDTDGSSVSVLLQGPGTGQMTLTNGRRNRGDISRLTVEGTTGASSLIIRSYGGRGAGTILANLSLTKASGAAAALGRLDTRAITLGDGGQLRANGGIGLIKLARTGNNAQLTVSGRVGALTVLDAGPSFGIDAGSLGSFVARTMGAGSTFVVALRIDSLRVNGSFGVASQIRVGSGGINSINVGSLSHSIITTTGSIDTVIVRGNMRASSIGSAIDAGRDGQYGTFDDMLQPVPSLTHIGSVTIGGMLLGTSNSAQHYGIVAQGDIGAVKVGGRVLNPNVNFGSSDDGRVRIQGAPFPDAIFTDPAYNVRDLMGWGDSAPDYSQNNVVYSSNGVWQSLKIINYAPPHYPHIDGDGKLRLLENNAVGPVLDDTTFQTNLSQDLPDYQNKSTYINYFQGEPEITVYNDLKQLQHAGFDGVRLYAVPPKVYVDTILAADRLSTASGKPFYVEYEVFAPDLSVNYRDGSVTDRIKAMYKAETNPLVPEGALQILHYVINVVGPDVFSKRVPLVYFTHENLVQPKGAPPQMTDDNASTPLLRWGINAIRDVLKKDLGANPLPAVTTPILAGQVVQVSNDVHPNVETLMKVIQADPNAPIAYDVYPFQWGDRYFNTEHEAKNDNDNSQGFNIIKDAFPEVNGQPIKYTDRTVTDQGEWIKDKPPIDPVFSVASTVTGQDPAHPDNGQLMWSLGWMVDRVNWIWGHLQHPEKGDTTPQVIAETGWATTQEYTTKEGDNGEALGKLLTGDLEDAKQYYQSLAAANFQVKGAPVMYFSAYDEPSKMPNGHPHMYSENHYGVFGWTGIPKLFDDSDESWHPLTKPFAVLVVAPFFDGPTPQRVAGDSPRGVAYTISINGTKLMDVPWYQGGKGWSDNHNDRETYLPNPMIFLSGGDKVTIHAPNAADTVPADMTLLYDAGGNTIKKVNDYPWDLVPPDTSALFGSPWTQNTGFNWYHPTDDFHDKVTYPIVYQDYWGVLS